MLEPEKQKRLEWILAVVFGIGSAVFIWAALAYVTPDWREAALKRREESVSKKSSAQAAKSEESPETESGVGDDKAQSKEAPRHSKGKPKQKDRPSAVVAALLETSGSSGAPAEEEGATIDEPQADDQVTDDPAPGSAAPDDGGPGAVAPDGPASGDGAVDDPAPGDNGTDAPAPGGSDPDGPGPATPGPLATELAYTGEKSGPRNGSITLGAKLSGDGKDLGGREVAFTITDGALTQAVSAITDDQGEVRATTVLSLPVGFYEVGAVFAGESRFTGSSAKTSLVVWEAIAGLSIKGNGWLTENGEKIDFNFSVKYTNKSDVPLGKLELDDTGGESGLKMRAEGLNWLVIASDNLAILHGSTSLNGVSGYSFEMLVYDGGNPGREQDFFELSLFGIPVVSSVIDGGNISVE